MVPLPPPAAKVPRGLSPVEGNPWVFPGRKKGTGQRNINECWDRIRKLAGFASVRVWKTCGFMTSDTASASRALALGESLTMIGKLLGHRQVQTTARYAHLARAESVKTSAARDRREHRGRYGEARHRFRRMIDSALAGATPSEAYEKGLPPQLQPKRHRLSAPLPRLNQNTKP